MTIQQIVDPACIEGELLKIWEPLAKENKNRASLFNLIIFNRLSPRTDYIRSIVQKVVEKFPCRSLFITEDPGAHQSYIKTAVSVLFPSSVDNAFACDQIDIGVAGTDLDRVPFTLLPHILPDLPVYLLWAEDPSQPHPLFDPLSRLATRIIFDSESADNLPSYALQVLKIHKQAGVDIADLNWARTEGWRDLIATLGDTSSGTDRLKGISSVKITYNSRETEFFCHLKIQSMYLLAWLSSRLQWKYQREAKPLHFEFASQNAIDAQIASTLWERLGPGTVISIEIASDHFLFEASRIPDQYHVVKVHRSSPQSCELPYQYVLGQTATGQSLVKEICMKGTSAHYLEMLRELSQDRLC